MIAFFICTLTQHPVRDAWGPKAVHLLLQSRGELTKHAYKIIPATSAKPVALGFIELTDAEFDAGQGIAGIWLYRLNGWRTRTVSQIPVGIRQAMNAMLTDREISVSIQLSDTVPEALDKIIQAIPGTPATLDDLVAAFQAKTGIET
jgi:hypothetical protein